MPTNMNASELQSLYPNAPSKLPSSNRFEKYNIKLFVISVTCCEEEYAIEQTKRIEYEITSSYRYAIEQGWEKSNSKYQNVIRNGRNISFEYYDNFFLSLPLAEYNKYKAPTLESVTFAITFDDTIDYVMDIARKQCQQSLTENEIDSFHIEENTVKITASGTNPFNKAYIAYLGISDKLRSANAISSQDKETGLETSIKNFMLTLAIIIFISMLLKWILGS